MTKKVTDDQPRVYFDCTKCPAYCCSVYERVQVTKRDLNRLARHFNVSVETARRRYTVLHKESGERVLKRVKDVIYPETCMFLNQETRGCTIYHGRPAVCREYPARALRLLRPPPVRAQAAERPKRRSRRSDHLHREAEVGGEDRQRQGARLGVGARRIEVRGERSEVSERQNAFH